MHKNPTGGKYMIFFLPVSLFFSFRPCNNFSTLTDCVLGGKYCKREIKSYFSRWTQSFFVTISELSISTGGKYMIFFPPVFIFAGGVLGENILCLCFSPWPCCMVFILPFFLDSFLDMSLRRNNVIFSPLVQYFSYLWQKNL